jgi:hypothetical protein
MLVAAGLVATSASARSRALHLVPVATFTAPVYATSAPNEPTNLYVVEQAGRIVVLQNGTVRATPFLDIRSIVQSGGVWSFKMSGGKARGLRRELFQMKGLSSFGEDADGELYLMSVDDGSLVQLAD